eukprot:gene3731-7413_t
MTCGVVQSGRCAMGTGQVGQYLGDRRVAGCVFGGGGGGWAVVDGFTVVGRRYWAGGPVAWRGGTLGAVGSLDIFWLTVIELRAKEVDDGSLK